MDRDESAVGIKSVSMNEPFFRGVSGIRSCGVSSSRAGTGGQTLCVSSFDTTTSRSSLAHGDRPRQVSQARAARRSAALSVRKIRSGSHRRFYGEAKVNGQVVAEAEVSALILTLRNTRNKGSDGKGHVHATAIVESSARLRRCAHQSVARRQTSPSRSGRAGEPCCPCRSDDHRCQNPHFPVASMATRRRTSSTRASPRRWRWVAIA